MGFLDVLSVRLESPHRYLFRISNALGSKDAMKEKIENIIDHCDLIFSIGAEYTLLAKEMVQIKRKNTPIIFTEVKDPVRLGLVDSLQKSGCNVTGTALMSRYYDKHLSLLFNTKPNIKDVTLIYDQTQELGIGILNVTCKCRCGGLDDGIFFVFLYCIFGIK
jgi:ABC-type uncharacterized transport system substrate-binding protein